MPVRKKILIADDDNDINVAVSDLLRHEGYDVLSVPEGDAALLETERWLPDLVLLDVNMPYKHGLFVCQRIKTDPALKHIKVVMFTVRNSDVDFSLAKHVQADGYVVKPFENDKLLETIRKHLEP